MTVKPRWRLVATTVDYYHFVNRHSSGIGREFYNIPRSEFWGRCIGAFSTPYGDRRCDLTAGHDGHHIRNDGCGRPEYHWGKR